MTLSAILARGNINCLRIAFVLIRVIDLGPARIPKSDCARHFIKGFSCRVIPCSSEDLIFPVILYPDQMGMSTGYDETEKRRFQFFIFNIIGSRYAPRYDAHRQAACSQQMQLPLPPPHRPEAHRPVPARRSLQWLSISSSVQLRVRKRLT